MSGDTHTDTDTVENRKAINLADYLVTLPVVGLLALVANAIGPGNPFVDSIPGILILLAMTFAGVAVTKFAPFDLPAVAWVTLVAMVATLPWTPGSEWILARLENIDFVALATSVLAYAAISIGRSEVDLFKRSGWKIIIVALLVFIGTFLGSALVAEVTLNIQGII